MSDDIRDPEDIAAGIRTVTGVDEHNIPSYAKFFKLNNVNTQMATGHTECLDNIKVNIKRGLPGIEELPDWRKTKSNGDKIALVGGGPTIKVTYTELDDFKTVVACGSSHDWLIKNGVIPTWCVIADPDPLSIKYLQHKNPQVTYLIASHCHPSIFDYLQDMPKVTLWHCYSGNYDDYKDIFPNGFQAIAGGCTVGLRSLCIAIMFGYTNIHFFGFDSCLEESNHHAYEFQTDQEKVGAVYIIKVGNQTEAFEKTYRCEGYHVAQANNFKGFYEFFGKGCAPRGQGFEATFHGDGLIAAMHANFVKDLRKEGLYE
jgi:hypothetical protein